MTHTPPAIGPLPQAPPPDPTGQPSQSQIPRPSAGPRHHNPWDGDIVPAQSQIPRTPAGPDPSHTQPTLPTGQALIIIDLAAWPQVQARLPVATPITLLMQALELTLGQLRELYIQSEVQRMRT